MQGALVRDCQRGCRENSSFFCGVSTTRITGLGYVRKTSSKERVIVSDQQKQFLARPVPSRSSAAITSLGDCYGMGPILNHAV